MDQIRSMQAFVGVVDTGGFTSAAALLGMPKATLSAAVADLEAHLKVRLLHRTTRRVSVTAEGAAYYERCVRILDDVRDAEESFSSRQANPRGTLRVDLSTSVASHLLLPQLASFMTRYPDIELELGCSDRPLNMLGEGIDCALRVGEMSDPSTVSRRVGTMQLVTCASPTYLERRGRPVHPHDLAQYDCLNYTPRSRMGFEWEFTRGDERVLSHMTSRLVLNDSNTYIDAVVAGLGIGRLPTYMFRQYPKCDAIELLMCDWLSDPIPFHVLYPSNRHLSSKVRVFVDWVAEILATHSGLQMCPAGQSRMPAVGVPEMV